MSRTTSSLSIVSQQQIVVTILVRAFLLQTIISICSFQCAARKLVENDVPLVQNQTGVVGVWTWNTSNPYSPFSDFRSEAARKYYTVWPEDIPGQPFRYPCEDRVSKLMLENFTYPDTGGLIQTVQYFDQGILEHFRPYWIKHKTCSKCWTSKPLGWPPIYCEQVDVYNLYYTRAFCAILHGLRFGVIMVLIQQVAFVVIAILIPVYYLNRSQGFHKMCLITKQHLQCLKWVSIFVVSLHLLALAVAGSLLVEGHVHSGDWKMAAMFTLAFYYRIQTASAFVASFLGQCADSLKSSHLTVPSGNGKKVHCRAEERKKEKSNIEMLIGQLVVCAVMVEYLYLTDDEHQNFMIQVVFGVVTVAVTFSMVTVFAVGGSSLWSIGKALWPCVRSKWNVGGLALRSNGKALWTYVRSLRNGS